MKRFTRALLVPLLALSYLCLTGKPLRADVTRFGVDQFNSRSVSDSLEDTGFPFQEMWETDLGGEVESQPIIVNERIYVQAGDRLLMLDMDGNILASSPALDGSPMSSGSSPTYAQTAFGDRIYQATRDHRLWALDPESLAPLWTDGCVILSAGGRPDSLYRVTSSPLAVNIGEKTYIAIGTGNGDQTGRPGQYADNGFFIIEDKGRYCEPVYTRQAAGEVTGSPLLSMELVVATQNIASGPATDENLLICFDLHKLKELEDAPRTDHGIPGSPAADKERLYVADRNGAMYCYAKIGDALSLLWSAGAPGGSLAYNLNSPTIGASFAYLPIRQYQGGGGLLVAYDKMSGTIARTLSCDSLLCSNVVYWQPQGSDREYLLVYEASGKTRLIDALTFGPVKGFMDESDNILTEITLPSAPTGVKAPEPIIGANYMLLVDGSGVMRAYIGRGAELDITTDIAVLDFEAPESVQAGAGGTWAATLANLTDEPVENAILEWLEDGKVLFRQTVSLSGGQRKTLSFKWSGRVKPGAVRAEVSLWPADPVVDIDERNNTKSREIMVGQPAVKVNCAQTRDTGSWQVVYSYISGYKIRSRTVTYTNYGVKASRTEYYTDYNSPIYSYVTVDYNEKLSASLTLSTGQGRLPDPAKPAPEDRDGRGAWEIIPFARGKGLLPDKVTRAGAGFTLQVETVYETDWETKIPPQCVAIGGSYPGPDRAWVEFYDTRGKMVKSVELERTSSGAGPGKAVWQLPVSKHTYLDGSLESKRWFYTSPDIPNGEYQVLARVEGAGLNKLYTCKTGSVMIYGSIYDDIYEKIEKKQ